MYLCMCAVYVCGKKHVYVTCLSSSISLGELSEFTTSRNSRLARAILQTRARTKHSRTAERYNFFALY